MAINIDQSVLSTLGINLTEADDNQLVSVGDLLTSKVGGKVVATPVTEADIKDADSYEKLLETASGKNIEIINQTASSSSGSPQRTYLLWGTASSVSGIFLLTQGTPGTPSSEQKITYQSEERALSEAIDHPPLEDICFNSDTLDKFRTCYDAQMLKINAAFSGGRVEARLAAARSNLNGEFSTGAVKIATISELLKSVEEVRKAGNKLIQTSE